VTRGPASLTRPHSEKPQNERQKNIAPEAVGAGSNTAPESR
jgi:hypothetical protein